MYINYGYIVCIYEKLGSTHISHKNKNISFIHKLDILILCRTTLLKKYKKNRVSCFRKICFMELSLSRKKTYLIQHCSRQVDFLGKKRSRHQNSENPFPTQSCTYHSKYICLIILSFLKVYKIPTRGF